MPRSLDLLPVEVLARNQAKATPPGRGFCECRSISDRGGERSRLGVVRSRDGEQAPAVLFLLNRLRKLSVDFFDLRLQLLPLVSKLGPEALAYAAKADLSASSRMEGICA